MQHGRMFSLSGDGMARAVAALWPFAQRVEDNRGGYAGGARSPVGIGAAVAVHVLVASVVLLIPREMYTTPVPPTITGRNIPIDPVPPEVRPEIKPRIETVVPTSDPFVPKPETDIGAGDAPTIGGGLGTDGGGIGSGVTIIDPPVILPDPVLVEPGMDPHYAAGFQPDYPGAMIRMGQEGKVVVRVTIGVDGRVLDIERLAATNEAFWLATQRHALRKWRFRPATRDGVAVVASKMLTVHFRLAD